MVHDQRDGVLLVILSVLGYAAHPVISKKLFEHGVQPLDIAFFRFLFTTIIFWAVIAARGMWRRQPVAAPGSVPPLPRLRLFLLGAFFVGESLTAFWGLERLPSATFVVLFYTYPAMVAILSMFLGERLSSTAWLAIAGTLFGVILTTPDFSAGLGGGNFIGVFMALADALMVAVYFLVINRLTRGQTDMLRISAITTTGAVTLMVVLVLFTGVRMPQGDAWLYLGLLALISTALPVFALNAGIHKLGATRAAIIATCEPIFTAVLALIFLGEAIQPIQWVGGAVIIGSVILLQVRRPEPETRIPESSI